MKAGITFTLSFSIIISNAPRMSGLRLQPGLHSPPTFSPSLGIDSGRLRHSTPLLQGSHPTGPAFRREINVNASETAANGYWNGWSSIKHIFALYVSNGSHTWVIADRR